MLHLHDTLSDRKHPLGPLEGREVRLYACGPTVYDHSHIGHMRTMLTYDVLVRHLRESGVAVRYVRNITDIDDKIIARANQRGEAAAALAARYAAAFDEDTARMGMLRPEVQPRVSDHLAEIVALIGKLVDQGSAYASEGDVYFSVASFAGYGKLSHRKAADLELGASGRLDDEEQRRKKSPADFALWKSCKPGEPSWPSPWGPGRPGWHIECSAMCMKHLGETIDIHGGGLDLVFPHHENELAQTEAVTGKPLSRFWVHGGFIECGSTKMSKSLGNFLTVREALELVEPDAVRYLMLTVHYRAPLGVEWERDAAGKAIGCVQLDEAERRVEYVYRTRERVAGIDPARVADGGSVPEAIARYRERVLAALDDDLNMPVALAATAELLKQINELCEQAKGKQRLARAALDAAHEALAVLSRVLGVGGHDPTAVLERIRARRAAQRKLAPADVQAKIDARLAARKAKDFAAADRLRDELSALGVELMDGPAGTTWRIP